MHTKNYKFEVKDLDEATGAFSGYASVFGNVDLDREVIDKGAFKRTLGHSKGVVPILWQHDKTEPVGWNKNASEDAHGLDVNGLLDIQHSEQSRRAYGFMKMAQQVGGRCGLSIGFRETKDGTQVKDGVLHFTDVELLEYSIVTFPANKEAIVSQVKGDKTTKRVAGVDLPASSFAYVGDPEKTGTWKLPIEFPGDEEKSKTHVRNALARFDQTEGIPEGERDAVLAKIRTAAKKLGVDEKPAKQAPDSNDGDADDSMSFSDAMASNQADQELADKRWQIEKAMHGAIDSIKSAPIDIGKKKLKIHKALHDYADALSDWHADSLDSEAGDQGAGKAEGDGEKLRVARKLSRAMSTIREGKSLMDAGHGRITKGYEVVHDISRTYLRNDVNLPNPMGGGKSESDPEDIHSLSLTMQELQKTARAFLAK